MGPASRAHWRLFPVEEEKEEEEEEEADASYILSLSSRPCSSSTAAVAWLLCWFSWSSSSRFVPLGFWQARDALHHGRYEPEGLLHVRRHPFPQCRRGRSSWSRLFSKPQSFPSCYTFQVVDASVVLVVLAMPRSCQQRQFAPKAGYAGCDAPRLCSSWLLQAKIFGILTGMTRRTVAAACTRLVLLLTLHTALSSHPWFAGP